MTENELIKLAQSGDSQAFGDLFTQNKHYLFKLGYKWFKRPEDLEDFIQNVALHIFQKIHQYNFKSKFSTWLYKVAQTVMWMDYRKRTGGTKKHIHIPLDEHGYYAYFDDYMKFVRGTPESAELNPEQRAELTEMVDLIQKRVTPSQARVLNARLAGMQQHEIVQAGIVPTIGTVKSQLYKGIGKLHQTMAAGKGR